MNEFISFVVVGIVTGSIYAVTASGLIAPQNPAQKIPGQCWLVAQYENGNWKRISPDPKSGFVCSPGGFYPASYKGVSR